MITQIKTYFRDQRIRQLRIIVGGLEYRVQAQEKLFKTSGGLSRLSLENCQKLGELNVELEILEREGEQAIAKKQGGFRLSPDQRKVLLRAHSKSGSTSALNHPLGAPNLPSTGHETPSSPLSTSEPSDSY